MLVAKFVSLEALERQVYGGDYNAAVTTLTTVFQGLETQSTSLTEGEDGSVVSDETITQTYCRMAAAIAAMLCDPRFFLDDQGFETMVVHKRNIATLFSATPFQTMGHVMPLVGDRDSKGDVVFGSQSALLKMLFACTVDVDVPHLQQIMEKTPLQTRTIFWLSMLDRPFLLTEQGERTRNQLLELGPIVEQGDLPQSLLFRLINVWMYSSYYNLESKHDVKLPLNKILRNSVRKIGIKQPPIVPRIIKAGKPRLAVLVEHFTSGHAMYRCYAWAVQQLGEFFTLILVGHENKMDEKSREMFDEVLSFPESTPQSKIIGKLVKLQPDVIYYPSLGMDLWTVIAAQFRLAPIQLMTLGHPATSMSEYIDYVVSMEQFVNDPDCFSETVVLTENGVFAFTPHPHQHKVSPTTIRANPKTVKIAAPCSSYKLNSEFIQCCSDIASMSSRKVEFHFFPNTTEITLLALRFRIEKLLPCVFYPTSDYLTYMNNISQCDIQLSSFPFGNTNGYLDGLFCGLPIVSMDGREVHSHSDGVLGRSAGLPEYCWASTKEEYIDGVLRLVENDSERVAISEKLMATDLEAVFYNPGVSNDFCNAVKWIYNNHEQIQDKNRHCWSIEDRDLYGKENNSDLSQVPPK
jgi:hypothetical protein